MAGGNRSAAAKKGWITRRGGRGSMAIPRSGIIGSRARVLPGDLVGRSKPPMLGDLVQDKRVKSYADVQKRLKESWSRVGAPSWKKNSVKFGRGSGTGSVSVPATVGRGGRISVGGTTYKIPARSAAYKGKWSPPKGGKRF